MPPYAMQLSLSFRINQRLHANAVQRIRLHEVRQVERVLDIFPCVLNAEIVPLSVRLAVKVRLHRQIVCMPPYLDSTLQVAALEAALKNQGVIRVSMVRHGQLEVRLEIVIELVRVVLKW